MYLQHYGFQDYPFAVTPDPAFLYLGTPHREALGHLLYGAGEHGGFVQLSGEVGTGKTTLVRALLDNRVPDLDVALCWQPQLDVMEFVATICDELGVTYDAERDTTLKALVDRLNAHLLQTHAAGRRTLLIIDEAQNLSRDVLEQLRLLTNLETSKHKLLRIILVGQPEMDRFLARHDLRQLAQRISARFELTSLDCAQTSAYIDHRLTCVGGSGRLLTPLAHRLVYWYTRGTPRLINLVCERALMGGYAQSRAMIGPLIVHRAAREVLQQEHTHHGFRRWLWPGLTVALAIGAVAWGSSTMSMHGVVAWLTHSDGGIVSEAQAASASTPHDRTTASVSKTNGAANGKTGAHMHVDARPLMLSDMLDKSETHASRHLTRVALATDVSASTGTSREHSGDDDTAESSGRDARKAQVVLPSGPMPPLPQGDAELNQLARLWGVFGAEIDSNCHTLRVGDLRCLSAQGELGLLERFNRPAILVLKHDGHQQRVLLTQLGDNSATLTGAQGTRRISRKRLARLWTGRFYMIWRASAGVPYIHDHMIGTAVVWLRRHLTMASGDNPDVQLGPESPIFDTQLEARVRNFQLMHGLKPDGIAGPRTQIMLNGRASGSGEPTLDGKTKKESD